ncbi:MAG: SGNH/GDSL hydrolase family protein [Candidatus Levybacteria bacterium]|nr:SGNH/GDSL hydrolase family protein [Candidatus Levybacteria bacterium]
MRGFYKKYEVMRQWVNLYKRRIMQCGIVCLFLIGCVLIWGYSWKKPYITKTVLPVPTIEASMKPSIQPTDTPFTIYKRPLLAKSDRYDIYLIGDSMTHAFGPRGGKFNEMLSSAYPGEFFEISNYAQANQNILLLPQRLHESVQADHDLLLQPILDGEPEVIIIESFGYNPLSQLGRTEGLKKQEEVLTDVMTTLTNRFPNTVITFLLTIAPDKKTYGQKVTDSDADGRWTEAEERIEYITNHRDYALEHNIPLINAYQESLDVTGDGDTKYINPDDNIHPSEEGLSLMGRIMTKRIQEEKIFPQN